ncbi:low-density lipoprotein receptor class A domain-containing protein 4-like [Genypterus blacodes]|uniref:low-density lipoprotein receptor class A domain-containing protein 4-like n=1 Tax=Genypterus blacodes TaxID=154954 RepID=UPI003F75DE12
MQNRTVPGSSSNTNSNGFCSCNCTGSQPQGMDISELEFVQIIIIVVVMTVMIVVIICLLNHYRLLALAFLSRHSQSHRDQATQLNASLWPDSVLAQQRTAEVMCEHLTNNLPSFMQQRLCRLQPTYPYLQQEIIDLPPIICLSDGEELPPYKGTCNLQLRDPEQQLELSRASVRAPPNRTIFDSDFIDMYIHSRSPQVPSSDSRVDAASAGMEDPPPSYSEAMGHYAGTTDFHCQYINNSQTQELQGTTDSETVYHSGSSSPESTTVATSGQNKNS